MNTHACSVCGVIKTETMSWFSLMENHWQDRLKITRWDESFAGIDATFHACGPEHVREFVYAWVTSSELLSPAKTEPRLPLERQQSVQSISDISIHRHSLKNTPEGLKSVLDAVVGALQNEFQPCEDQLPYKIQPQKISLHTSAAHAS